MKMKVTPAGQKILAVFDPRPEDGSIRPHKLLMYQVKMRSKVRGPQVYRAVDKLIRDGLLASSISHDGLLYSRTETGKSALHGS